MPRSTLRLLPGGDLVRLVGLRCQGCHGVAAEERALPQTFVVDLEFRLDLGPAGRRDDLSATVDYALAARLAADVVSGPPRRLLEGLAEEIAARLLAAFNATQQVRVRLHKPQAALGLAFADVYVQIGRRR